MVLLNEPIAPTLADARTAGESGRKLAAMAGGRKSIRLKIQSGRKSQALELPPGAVQLLLKLLGEMSKGNAVAVLSIHTLLTTQQAADVLGVSRPFIVKQLRGRRIPFQLVGTHRRILLKDVMAYKQASLRTHEKAMNALVEQAQDTGLGY